MKKFYKHPTIKVLELKERLAVLQNSADGKGTDGMTGDGNDTGDFEGINELFWDEEDE